MLRTAGEGWRVGAACPVREWRDGWAGYAELGAVAWAAIDDLDRRTDSNTWSAMEQAFREDRLAHASAHPALEATSALVRKMLEQTGRNHVAHAPDERTLCALEVPARLWRALAEAGPCPQPPAPPEFTDRWWLVEIEHPADDEPNAVALWKADGAEVALAAFLGVEDGNNPPCLTVVTWRTGADGERTRAGVAVLGDPVRVDDPHSPESQAGTTRVIDTLAAPDTGSVARAKAAIALHLDNDDEAAPLGPYRASTAGAAPTRQGATATRRSFTALPIYAGLDDAVDRLRTVCGISRLSDEARMPMGPLRENASREAAKKLFEKYHVRADEGARAAWTAAIDAEALDFAQHLHVSLKAASSVLTEHEGAAQAEDAPEVRRRARAARERFYSSKIGGIVEYHEEAMLDVVHRATRPNTRVSRRGLTEWAREHMHRRSPAKTEYSEAQAEALVQRMRHEGILHITQDRRGEVAIPSLHTWLTGTYARQIGWEPTAQRRAQDRKRGQ